MIFSAIKIGDFACGTLCRDGFELLMNLRQMSRVQVSSLAAGLDFELRCRLMGRAAARWKYGNGRSTAYHREQMLRVAHPYDESLLYS